MEFKTFGVNLAKARIAKGLSQYELSLRIGKSTNYIHRVEIGDVNISLKSLLGICKALEIDPCELFRT
ncbi:MAG: helix-turn-helix transcriptional regulator [Firmicutes bacterium]|nr:helix-turn-helix transcriptional regulator [Bacillota bacterium]